MITKRKWNNLSEKMSSLGINEKCLIENFINISKWLRFKGYSAPKIYNKNLSKGYCILEDFTGL